jgi:hypothetical protein
MYCYDYHYYEAIQGNLPSARVKRYVLEFSSWNTWRLQSPAHQAESSKSLLVSNYGKACQFNNHILLCSILSYKHNDLCVKTTSPWWWHWSVYSHRKPEVPRVFWHALFQWPNGTRLRRLLWFSYAGRMSILILTSPHQTHNDGHGLSRLQTYTLLSFSGFSPFFCRANASQMLHSRLAVLNVMWVCVWICPAECVSQCVHHAICHCVCVMEDA